MFEMTLICLVRPLRQEMELKTMPSKISEVYTNSIHHLLLRQLFYASWHSGGSLFKCLGWGSKITPVGTAVQVWLIPTQPLGDISDYNKLLFY